MVVAGLILNLIATVLLFLGSKETPWGVQTWDGESEGEKSFRRRRKLMTWAGFILLFIGFLLQLIGVLGY
jgi:uncharacterized membrane protein